MNVSHEDFVYVSMWALRNITSGRLDKGLMCDI